MTEKPPTNRRVMLALLEIVDKAIGRTVAYSPLCARFFSTSLSVECRDPGHQGQTYPF
jgi:hypothetical protein